MQISFNNKVINLDTPKIMGLLNVTPDSFSDGGKWNSLDKAVEHRDDIAGKERQFIQDHVHMQEEEVMEHPEIVERMGIDDSIPCSYVKKTSPALITYARQGPHAIIGWNPESRYMYSYSPIQRALMIARMDYDWTLAMMPQMHCFLGISASGRRLVPNYQGERPNLQKTYIDKMEELGELRYTIMPHEKGERLIDWYGDIKEATHGRISLESMNPAKQIRFIKCDVHEHGIRLTDGNGKQLLIGYRQKAGKKGRRKRSKQEPINQQQ